MITILTYLLLVVEAVCSVLLVGVILLQRTKGQGMGLAFGAGMGESLFGSQVGNVLTRTTVTLAVIFLANTTVLAILGTQRTSASAVDSVTDMVPTATAPAPQPMAPPPGGGMPAADFPSAPAAGPMEPLAAPEAIAFPEPGSQPIAAEPAGETPMQVPVEGPAEVPAEPPSL